MTPEQLRQACEAAGLISEPSEIQDLWRLPPITENEGHYLYDDHVALLPTVAALLRDRCVQDSLMTVSVDVQPVGRCLVHISKGEPVAAIHCRREEIDTATITACMQALGLWEVET